MSARLFVHGLSSDSTERTLLECFGAFGPLVGAEIHRNQDTGACAGFGFVTFANEGDAAKAIAWLDGVKLQNAVLRVCEADDEPIIDPEPASDAVEARNRF